MATTSSPSSTVHSAIIFGGAGCIGSATALCFLRRGFEVIVVDKQEVTSPDLTPHLGKKIHQYQADLTCTDELDAAIFSLAAARSAQPAHVVSLAGGALPGEFEGLACCHRETMSSSIDLNLKSHLFILQRTLELLKQSHGEDRSITVVSSINAVRSHGLPAYSAAKAGLIGLVGATAKELGDLGIRINAVLPGTVPTPRTLKQPKDFEALRHSTLLGRLAQPHEIGQIIAALAIDCTCITGQAILADCGQSMAVPPH